MAPRNLRPNSCSVIGPTLDESPPHPIGMEQPLHRRDEIDLSRVDLHDFMIYFHFLHLVPPEFCTFFFICSPGAPPLASLFGSTCAALAASKKRRPALCAALRCARCAVAPGRPWTVVTSRRDDGGSCGWAQRLQNAGVCGGGCLGGDWGSGV